jgi:hypothetical protein
MNVMFGISRRIPLALSAPPTRRTGRFSPGNIGLLAQDRLGVLREEMQRGGFGK